MPKRDDDLLLQDMHEAGSKIERYINNCSFKEFVDNEMKIDAVVRNFEIIGETARSLSPEFRNGHPQMPWRDIISYRNLLIHEYFGVSLSTIWDIIQMI